VCQTFENFNDLLNENKDRIFNLLFRLTGDYHTAEDLFQETFLRAYRGFDHYEGRSALSTWLHAIAVNVFRDHTRRSRKDRYEKMVADTEGFLSEDQTGDPEATLLMKERQEDLQRLLVSLKPALRVPVVLFYIDGLSIREIAAVTGKSESSIKVSLHRARKLLKTELGREG
jgi:RNA polymerase sigma-70 factor (ECF subfamily)